MELYEAVIPCAGRGERMGALTEEIPKPMIPFEGVPFLQFVIYHLKRAGIRRFIIPVAYKAENIKSYFGDGSAFGVEIEYVQSTVDAESGGSFFRGLRHVRGPGCLMQYGDAFVPYDMKEVVDAFKKSGKMGMVVASKRYTIEGFADKNNLELDADNNVVSYGKGNPRASHLDVGVALFRKETIELFEGDEFKLAPYIFPKLAALGEMAAFPIDVKSVGIGNPEKVERFKKFLAGKDMLENVKMMKQKMAAEKETISSEKRAGVSEKKMKAVVTGAAGFIGSHMADRLLDEGWNVVALDSMKTGHQEFFEHNLSNPNYEFVQADIMDLDALKKAFRGADVVFHFAANADIKACLKQPEVDYQVNAGGTFNVLEAMRANGVKKIVFSSTGSVYGEPEVFPTPEDAPFPVQTSMYAAAKLYSEALISAYCEGYGFDGYIYRFVSIMGERYTHGVVFDFMKQLSDHPDHIDFLSDGTPLKSYLYIGDCTSGMLHGLKHGSKGINIFNLGTDESRRVKEMADYVVEQMGLTGVKYNFSESKRGWVGDSPHIHLDITKLRNLGWEPKKTIKQAVQATVEYIKQNKWVVGEEYFRSSDKREQRG